ncbi:pirin family protein [Geitlerinema sp. PCC 7407]|uniref:pirin family protein n=1 Tax=Geitlerinema sp. PCC 7407 TaxID=1173025 RepID=UPI00029FDD01|nr:pirin family protein [Geitlerinema sp. PCC 7407]AFY68217.1 Pirin domain protein [Geitlerinema sp. PCC 7407]
MLTLRKAHERGHANYGWLNTNYTFSFANYYDPQHMGFRALRVINEDYVAPGQGFGTHGHRDMEIITYVLEGALAHKDSLGNGAQIVPGEVQRMTAGTGIQHSEFNASDSEQVHLLQIWLLPETQNLPPSYEQKAFSLVETPSDLKLVASRDGRDGSVTVHQSVDLYAAVLEPASEVVHVLQPGRHAWVQVARGQVTVNGQPMEAGDGAAISQEEKVAIATGPDHSAEFLLFDLA